MEPGMAEVAARTGWIVTGGLNLGSGTKAQKEGMSSPNHSLVDRTRSHQVSPPHKAGPRVGVLKGLKVSDIFENLSKTLHPLPATLYFADNFRGLQNPHPTLSFSWGLCLKELPSRCGGRTRECPQKAHNRNLGEAT